MGCQTCGWATDKNERPAENIPRAALDQSSRFIDARGRRVTAPGGSGG